MAKINYQQVGWDTTKYFNPTNMNQMDNGIKAACDKADATEAAIADVNNKLGNTDISAIGDGTVTGGLDALNSNLQKQVIITQSITIETTIEPYKMIVSRFCIRPLIPYVLLSAIHPSSGTKTQFFLNDSGDLYATSEGVQSVGDWVINGSYIAK